MASLVGRPQGAPSRAPPAGFEPAHTAPEAAVTGWRISAATSPDVIGASPYGGDRSAYVPDHGRTTSWRSAPWLCFLVPVPSHTGQVTGMQVCTFPSQEHRGAGYQAAAEALREPIRAVHDRSYAGGLPPGGLHPIGADHCPEREPSRAWSAGLRRCFGRAEAGQAGGVVRAGRCGSWNP
jgi:hypothetical protein